MTIISRISRNARWTWKGVGVEERNRWGQTPNIGRHVRDSATITHANSREKSSSSSSYKGASTPKAKTSGKGLSIKDVRYQGGLSSADILQTKGGRESLQMRTSALFGAKTSDFSKFKGVW